MTSNPRYTMLDSRDIRCTRCGYENDPQFRFCGMCGASLRPLRAEDREEDANVQTDHVPVQVTEPDRFSSEPMPVEPLLAQLTATQKFQPDPPASSYSSDIRNEFYATEPVHGQRTPVSVSGPSFLGLSESNDRGVEYLLEDEPHHGRMRAVVGFLLLLAICAAGIFHWRKAGYPWPSHAVSESASTQTATKSDPVGGTAPPLSQEATTGSEATSGGKPFAAAPEKQMAAADTSVDHASETQTSEKSSDVGVRADSDSQAQSDNTKPSDASSTSPRKAAHETSRAEGSGPIESSRVVVNPGEDNLYLDGQKYLYGRGGARQNCALAQQNLLASAKNDNSKSESTLGTMYATGHCAPRDIPLAYRWFARALHADPRNSRLEKDAEIMWNQMTPAERQIALKTQ